MPSGPMIWSAASSRACGNGPVGSVPAVSGRASRATRVRASSSREAMRLRWTATTIANPETVRAMAMTIAAAPTSRSRTFVTSAAVRAQPVAGSAHGFDRGPAERVVDLAPEVADVDLDDVGVAVEVLVPHVLEQVGLAHHDVGVAEEIFEHRA